MCNPRRIKIRTVEQLAEAWTAVLVGAAVATDEVTAEATLTQPYGENLPPAFRAVFERRLGSDPAWSYREGQFRAQLDSGHISYDSQTGDLEFSVRLTDQVAVEGQATVEIGGEMRQTLDEEFEGEGRSRAAARHDAVAMSRAAVERERQRLRAAAAAERIRAGADDANLTLAETLARENAEQLLEGVRASRAESLSAQARAELETRRDEYLTLINLVYAGALREVMRAFAEERGAVNFESSEEDGVIDISFEWERAG